MAATKLVGVNRGLREVHQLLGTQASVMRSFDIATSLVLMSPRAAWTLSIFTGSVSTSCSSNDLWVVFKYPEIYIL